MSFTTRLIVLVAAVQSPVGLNADKGDGGADDEAAEELDFTTAAQYRNELFALRKHLK